MLSNAEKEHVEQIKDAAYALQILIDRRPLKAYT
jgi:hypothetical protein